MRGTGNFQRLYEAAKRDNDIDRLQEDIQAGLDEGHISARDFSIREIFRATVDGGSKLVEQWTDNPTERVTLQEAGVSTTHFSRITKQLLSNEVMEGYNDAAFIGDSLARTIPVSSPYGERVPGLGRIGDEAEAIGEGQPYPLVGFGEDFIQTPDPIKRGMICPITKEAIIADRTGQILDRGREVGYWAGYNKELQILSVATGVTSTYNRLNRGVVATYGDNAGDHDWDNLSATTALVDWTDLEAAKLLFDGMVDPNTGTPVMVMGNTILVPQALEWTARRIVSATEVEHVDNQANAATYRTKGGNPAAGMGLNILTSPLVSTVSGSSTTWFLGDFPKAFAYRELWPITTSEAPANNEEEFTRDIAARFKVSHSGVASAEDPRYVVKCTA